MRIKKLKLRGSIGIWKGLGQEEIDLDFSQFGRGLIALTGKNGSGKTTIMENLHPYRTMVSRMGALANHFYLRDSYRILEFDYLGDSYVSKIYIDAKTGASEAYLYRNGKPVNDGKVTTYDEVITELLGSEELFFNSVFSGQKSKGIAELKPAERRKLFYELLNLDKYEELHQRAKARTEDEKSQIISLESVKEVVSQSIPDVKELEAQKIKTIDEISNLEKREKELKKELKELQAKRDEYKFKAQEQAKDKELRAKKEYELNVAQNEFVVFSNTITKEILSIESQINELKEISSQKEELRKKVEAIRELESAKVDFQEDLNNALIKLKEEGDKYHSFVVRTQELKNKELVKENEANSLRNKIADTGKKIKMIEEVPCSEDVGKSCMFLKGAVQAKNELPDFEKELEKLESELLEIGKEFDSLLAKKNEQEKIVDSIQKDVADYKKNIENLDFEISERKLNNSEKMLEDAENAGSKIKELETQIKFKRVTLNNKKQEYDNLFGKLKKEIEELKKDSGEDYQKLLNEIDYPLRSKENSIEEIIKLIEGKKAEIMSIDEKITDAKNKKQAIEKYKNEILQHQKEQKEWLFLAKAFDKTGIPILKLENSGIQITTIANELLSLFENPFRIVFETTSMTKDGKKLKEVFNINVISGNDVVEISNLSGGQQVWVETAIQLAIMLFIRESGSNIETVFLDEKDGALDIDNANRYLQMLELAHRKANVFNTFVITHRPELIDLIPQKIILNNGINIEV